MPDILITLTIRPESPQMQNSHVNERQGRMWILKCTKYKKKK